MWLLNEVMIMVLKDCSMGSILYLLLYLLQAIITTIGQYHFLIMYLISLIMTVSVFQWSTTCEINYEIIAFVGLG